MAIRADVADHDEADLPVQHADDLFGYSFSKQASKL
jgi:hypothetical protein